MKGESEPICLVSFFILLPSSFRQSRRSAAEDVPLTWRKSVVRIHPGLIAKDESGRMKDEKNAPESSFIFHPFCMVSVV